MIDKFIKSSLIMFLVFLLSCRSQQMVESRDDINNVVKAQRALIVDNISDDEKQAKLLDVIEKIDSEAKKFVKYYSEHRKKVTELIKDQKVSRQEFEAELVDINDHYEKYLKTILQKRKEMITLTTKDEWKKITDWDNTLIPE